MNKYEIIMIDDDEDDIEMMKEAFDVIDFGHSFKHYSSGRQFFNYLNNLPSPDLLPSVAILDYNMPELPGDEVLAQLRKDPTYDNMVVVFFSAGISPYQKTRLESMGSVCCIMKPNTYQDFLMVATEFKHAIDQKYSTGSEKAMFSGANMPMDNSI